MVPLLNAPVFGVKLQTLPVFFLLLLQYLIILCSVVQGHVDPYICHTGHLFINVQLTKGLKKPVSCWKSLITLLQIFAFSYHGAMNFLSRSNHVQCPVFIFSIFPHMRLYRPHYRPSWCWVTTQLFYLLISRRHNSKAFCRA